MNKYEKNKPKKWVVTMVGALIGAILGSTIPTAIGFVNHAKY